MLQAMNYFDLGFNINVHKHDGFDIYYTLWSLILDYHKIYVS